MKPETLFRKKIDAFLKQLGNTVDESIQQRSIRGTADKIICCNGMYIWMEIKTDEGVQDPLQQYKASLIQVKGKGIVLVTRPHNWERTKDFLTLLDRGIYDKNVLRTIEPSPIPKSSAKASKCANARPPSIQD